MGWEGLRSYYLLCKDLKISCHCDLKHIILLLYLDFLAAK